MDRIELLLPAGNMDMLRAAIAYGADSVYLGLHKYSAREYAGNFSSENLKHAIEYAHKFGVKAYVTFNTLVKDSEMKEWLSLVQAAYLAGCDAIIMQDYWLLPLINSYFPELAIHLSTQAGIMSYAGIEAVRRIGRFQRVILARELTCNEISTISTKAQRIGVQTEIFCHGALCMCYSGQCLFSSIIGGRSGNRGRCAQPCRKQYNGNYPLSTKDLNLIEHLGEIINAGVASIKVEGRMRSKLYVKVAANAYRNAIDQHYMKGSRRGESGVSEEIMDELLLAFNREFSDNYFTGKNLHEVISPDMPMNRGILLGKYRNSIKLLHGIECGDGYCLRDGNGRGNVRGGLIRKICNMRGEPMMRAEKGNTVSLGIKSGWSGKIYLTSSRRLEEKYSDKSSKGILDRNPICVREAIVCRRELKKAVLPEIKPCRNRNGSRIIAYVEDIVEAMDAISGKPYAICVSAESGDLEQISLQCPLDVRLFIRSREIATDKDIENDIKRISAINNASGYVLSNIGFLSLCGHGKETILDYNMNIFNSHSLASAMRLGLSTVMSVELNFNELTQIRDKRFYVLVHGELCIAKTKAQISERTLLDEKGIEFKARPCAWGTRIFNCRKVGLFQMAKSLDDNGIKYYVINARKNVRDIIGMYKQALSGAKVHYDREKYTYGHLKRGVD